MRFRVANRYRLVNKGLASACLAASVGSAALAGCADTQNASAPQTDPALAAASNEMAKAVRDRLALMPDVAWTKYQQRLAVDDPTRDAAITTAFVQSATAQRIPAAVANAVITAQIESAKRVQRSLIQQWGTGVRPQPTTPALSIQTVLRPKIDATTNRLLHGMVTFLALPAPKNWPEPLSDSAKSLVGTLPSGITETDYDLALMPLGEWRKAVAPVPATPPKAPVTRKKPVPTNGQ